MSSSFLLLFTVNENKKASYTFLCLNWKTSCCSKVENLNFAGSSLFQCIVLVNCFSALFLQASEHRKRKEQTKRMDLWKYLGVEHRTTNSFNSDSTLWDWNCRSCSLPEWRIIWDTGRWPERKGNRWGSFVVVGISENQRVSTYTYMLQTHTVPLKSNICAFEVKIMLSCLSGWRPMSSTLS